MSEDKKYGEDGRFLYTVQVLANGYSDMLINFFKSKGIKSTYIQNLNGNHMVTIDEDIKLEENELAQDNGNDISNEVKDAVKVLTTALNKDPSYRMSWRANIAMAFVDEYCAATIPKGADIEETEYKKVHKIANDAAYNFLNLLCRD